MPILLSKKMSKNKMKHQKVAILLAIFLSFLSGPFFQARAGEAPPTPNTSPAPKKKANILDFEAEVIEGERKTPDLFIQLSMEQQQTKAVTFSRKNFNNYHAVDSQKRPKYQEK